MLLQEYLVAGIGASIECNAEVLDYVAAWVLFDMRIMQHIPGNRTSDTNCIPPPEGLHVHAK